MMLLATASVSAEPDYDFKYDGLCYNIISVEDRTVEVAPLDRYSGMANSNYVKGDLIIPERFIYDGKTYKVTSIGDEAFRSCSGLTSVEIPNSVTSIGDRAFYNCSGLTSVEIPNSVTSIGTQAFESCSGLTSVEIPNSVTSIASSAFSGCSGLMEIKVAEGNQNYVSIDGCLYSKDVTTLCCCPGAKTSITIPNSVTSIGSSAFSGCSGLKEVYCKMETPVETEATFRDKVYMNAVLYVPEGCREAYEKVDPWRNFWTIEEFDPTGISGVTVSGGLLVTVDGGTIKVDNADGQTVNVYDAAGTLVKSVKAGSGSVEIAVPGSGVYIVKVGGKAVKIAM